MLVGSRKSQLNVFSGLTVHRNQHLLFFKFKLPVLFTPRPEVPNRNYSSLTFLCVSYITIFWRHSHAGNLLGAFSTLDVNLFLFFKVVNHDDMPSCVQNSID